MLLSMAKRSGLKEEITGCQVKTEQVLQARVRLVDKDVDRVEVEEVVLAALKETVYALLAGMKLPILRECPAAR